MSREVIAAQLQIRLNGHMKCDDSFLYAQNEPELIQSARRTQKYNFKKKIHLHNLKSNMYSMYIFILFLLLHCFQF